MRWIKWVLMMGVVGVVLSLGGCFSQMVNTRSSVTSSLVDFLYPGSEKAPEKAASAPDTLPALKFPVRVGLAFVPSTNGTGLPESDQMELLSRVKKAFESESYIKEIALIPNTYMRGKKGFQTLTQVGALYNVDLIALMSYDQMINAADNKASLLYWTLVGAYFVKGSENAVNTFVDIAIFDIGTQRLLLRSAGTSVVENSSTLVDAEAQMRKNRLSGFQLAVDDLNKSLASELVKFSEKLPKAQQAAIKNAK